MAGENQVPLEILVEVKDALGRLEEFEKKSSKSISGVEKTFNTMKAAAVAAVAVFAGKQVVDFFGAGIDAAIKQENAMRQLNTALEQTGEASDAALKSFADFANEMEATTKFGDDVVITQVAIAKSFGLSNKQAEELVKTAADLASATGDTLDGAVQKLGKTYSGTTGKLDDMVPSLRGLTKAQLANGDAVKILADRYKGAAANEIKTFAGALLQAENAFGNFQEAIGTTIVQNDAVVAAISGVRDIFVFLEKTVVENEDAIKSFITAGLEVTVVTAAATAEALRFLVEAFQVMVTQVIDGVANIADLTAGLLSFIPGMDEAALAVVNFGDDAHAMSENANKSLGGVTQGFTAFTAVVDGAAQKVFDADHKIVTSTKEVEKARATLAKRAAEDAAEIEKLAKAADSFETALRQATADEATNLKAKLDEQLATIQGFQDAGTRSAAAAEELRVVAVSTYVDKVAKLREDETKKFKDELDKQADAEKKFVDDMAAIQEKQKSTNAALAGNPFASTGPSTPSSLTPGAQEGIAGTAGVLSSVLDGAAGAKSLISAGSAAFADAFIPGIGGVVGSIVSKLAQGPEATKEFIKQFIDAVPDIMTAVAESMPVVVEAFVDGMINGGARRIAVATIKAMAGEAILKSIGKQLGLDFGRSFNAQNLGPKIGNGIVDGARKLFDLGKEFGASASRAFKKAGSALVDGLVSAFKTGATAAGKLTLTAIRTAFIEANRKMLIEWPKMFATQLFVILPGKIRDGFLAGLEAVKAGLASTLAAFGSALQSIGSLLTNSIASFSTTITTTVPAAIQAGFTSAIEFFRVELPALLGKAGMALAEGLNTAGANLAAGLKAGADSLAANVKEGVGTAVAAAKASVGDFVAGVKEAFSGVTTPFKKALNSFKWPTIPTPGWVTKLSSSISSFINTPAWLDRFQDLIKTLTSWIPEIKLPGGGGGGKPGPVTGIPGSPFATGGLVPPGFPNDTFAARLTSNELVVPPGPTRQLSEFLDREARSDHDAEVLSMLARIATLLDGGQRPIQVVVDGNVIARTVHAANYRNVRTAR